MTNLIECEQCFANDSCAIRDASIELCTSFHKNCPCKQCHVAITCGTTCDKYVEYEALVDPDIDDGYRELAKR